MMLGDTAQGMLLWRGVCWTQTRKYFQNWCRSKGREQSTTPKVHKLQEWDLLWWKLHGWLKNRPCPHSNRAVVFLSQQTRDSRGWGHPQRSPMSRWCRGAEVSGGNAHEENMQLPLGRFTAVTFSILQSCKENGVGGRLRIALLKGSLLKWVPTL